MRRKRIQEEKLPVPAFYKKLPKNYQRIISQQGLELLLREGITDELVEDRLGHAIYSSNEQDVRIVQLVVAIQQRDLSCQILLELRKLNAYYSREARIRKVFQRATSQKHEKQLQKLGNTLKRIYAKRPTHRL